MGMGEFESGRAAQTTCTCWRARPTASCGAVMRFISHCGKLSLDTMRRVGETPNGLNEALVCRALEVARAAGSREVSLNYAGSGSPGSRTSASRSRSRKAARAARASSCCGRRFQMERLVRFNEKFSPSGVRAIWSTSRGPALPRAVFRVLQAEGYLPPARRGSGPVTVRGRGCRGSQLAARAEAPGSGMPESAVPGPRADDLGAAGAAIVVGLLGAYSYGAGLLPAPRLRDASHSCRAPAPGRLLNVHFYSPALHRSADYLVYLPPGYTPAQAATRSTTCCTGCPGAAGVHRHREHGRRLDNQLSEGHAAADDPRLSRRADRRQHVLGLRVGEHAVGQLRELRDRRRARRRPPLLDARPTAQDRVIAGFSAGAYGAINIALHHLSVFGIGAVVVGLLHADPQRRVRARQPRRRSPTTARSTTCTRSEAQLAANPLRVFMFVGRDDELSRADRADGARAAGRRRDVALRDLSRAATTGRSGTRASTRCSILASAATRRPPPYGLPTASRIHRGRELDRLSGAPAVRVEPSRLPRRRRGSPRRAGSGPASS